MQVEAREPEPARAEILELAPKVTPREFYARLALWRKGGLSGGMSESLVKSSRSAKMPALDRMDQSIQDAGLRYAAYVDGALDAISVLDLKKAARLLRAAVALQDVWLFPIEVASETMANLVSDDPKCLNCPENTPRLRAGRCHACYQYYRLHDFKKERPEELWSRPKKKRAS